MMQLFLFTTLSSIAALCIATLLLKFIRKTISIIIVVRKVKWGAMRIKLVDWKIAVEITALNIELDLLSAGHPLTSVATSSNSSSASKDSHTSAKKETDASFSSVLAKKYLWFFSGIFRSIVSYLFSCFTIVVRNCIFELRTIDEDCIQVTSK